MISSYGLQQGMLAPNTPNVYYYQGRPYTYTGVAPAVGQAWQDNAMGVAPGTSWRDSASGRTVAPVSQGMISPGTANMLSGLITGLGNAASTYIGAAPQTATMPIVTPQIAQLPLANLGERSLIRG